MTGAERVYRDVVAIRDARSLILASAASQIGDWLYNAALLAFVYSATGSPAWVGAATVCRLVPYVVLGPVGGLLADRYDRRTVLLRGDLARLAIMLVLAATVATDGPVLAVMALTAAASAAGTAERPAAMALLPRLVGEGRLGPANALLHTVQDLGVVTGPAIGALLLAVGPDWAAFVVNAATFGVSASLIATIAPGATGRGGGEHRSAVAELVHGLRTTVTTRFVVPLLLVVAMVEFTYGAQTVQLVLYADDRLDIGSSGYGYLLALSGLGGVLSAVLNGRLSSSHRAGLIAVIAGSAAGATQLAYAATDAIAIAVVVTVVGGVGLVSCEVVAETALARVVPPQVLGRVMGVFDALSVAAMVLGASLAPAITSWTSLRTGLAVLGVVAVSVTLASTVGLRGLAELSQRRGERLASRLAILDALPVTIGLPRVALEQLADAAQVCSLPAGVAVVRQGAPAHAFFAVIDGSLVVERDGTAVGHIETGGHFGERGLLDNAPRNATVTTTRPSTLLRLEGDEFLDALQSAPAVRNALDHSNPPRSSHGRTGDESRMVDDRGWTPT
jgi:MFS family permease